MCRAATALGRSLPLLTCNQTGAEPTDPMSWSCRCQFLVSNLRTLTNGSDEQQRWTDLCVSQTAKGHRQVPRPGPRIVSCAIKGVDAKNTSNASLFWEISLRLSLRFVSTLDDPSKHERTRNLIISRCTSAQWSTRKNQQEIIFLPIKRWAETKIVRSIQWNVVLSHTNQHICERQQDVICTGPSVPTVSMFSCAGTRTHKG